jgi:hypothetical protein
MNPRTDYSEADSVTARAYATLFRRIEDEFRFSIDQDVDPLDRAEPMLIVDDNEYDSSTIGFMTVGDEKVYETVRSELVDLGLDILEENTNVDEHEGEEHTMYNLKASAPEDLEAEWNVPHLIVYGWLRPELEEVLSNVFPKSVESADVRNHYLVYGEELDNTSWEDLSLAISNYDNLFDDARQDLVSDVRTSDYI